MRILSLGVASFFVLYLAVVAPMLGPRGYRKSMQKIALQPDRRAQFYRRTAVSEWLLVIIVGIIALFDAVPLSTFGLRAPYYGWLQDLDAPAYTSWLFSLFLIVAVGLFLLVSVMSAERRLENPERMARLRPQFLKAKEMLPHTALERRLWLLLSVSAGVCEEIFYRGFLPWYFLQIGSILNLQISFLQTLAFSTLLFALIHSYRGVRGIVFAAVIGATCAYLYFITDSLLLAIAFHTLIDAQVALITPTILRLLAEDEGISNPQTINTR